MASPNIDLSIDAAADFFARFTALNANQALVDLSGYTAKSQIRDGYGGALIGTFIATPNGLAGTVDLFMDSVDTVLMPSGTYFYDVLIQNAATGDVKRLVQGQVNVSARVTV